MLPSAVLNQHSKAESRNMVLLNTRIKESPVGSNGQARGRQNKFEVDAERSLWCSLSKDASDPIFPHDSMIPQLLNTTVEAAHETTYRRSSLDGDSQGSADEQWTRHILIVNSP